MKALVKFKAGRGKETLQLMNVAEPIPKRHEIKIKIEAVGICGTDIHIMLDEFKNYPPVIIGHEFIGVIADKGEDVTDFCIGDHVVSLSAVETCGKCTYCRQDLRMLCDNRKSIGCFINGAMAEYMVIPADAAFKVPEEIPDKASLVISEPAVCAVRGVIEKSMVRGGDVVVVSGPGAIGQLAAQAAKIIGAVVIVSGLITDQERLRLAKKLGADYTAENETILQEILKSIGSNGADVVFECAGSEGSARTCINVVKKNGIFSQIGLYGKEVRIDMDKLLFKEVRMTNSFATERSSWEIYLKLIRKNQFNLAPLISKKLPLAQWEEAFDLFMESKEMKIILVP